MFGNLFEDKKPEEIEIPPNGISLDLLRAVYRNPSIALPVRMRAAIAALPHEVPRLAVTAQIVDNDIATMLDARIKRFEEMRLIEATNATKVIDAKPQPVETKPPLARTSDRRFRRF